MAVFEVPDAAMHQARRPAGGAAGEVARLDERDAQAAQCRVARDARTGDSPADDRDVERLDVSRRRTASRQAGGSATEAQHVEPSRGAVR